MEVVTLKLVILLSTILISFFLVFSFSVIKEISGLAKSLAKDSDGEKYI